MKNLLNKNKKICLVPEDIKGALSTEIQKITTKSIDLNLSDKDIKYYKQGDAVELFTVVEDGMLYFKPVVKEVDKTEKTIKLEYTKEQYELLQRREYTRVDFSKEFTLKDKENSYICECIDICAGGMKFATEAELSCAKDYIIEFTLESTIPIQCFFQPIRVDNGKNSKTKAKNKKNIVSGRFIALKNIDKIAIVQFCFKKQMENTNK